MSATWNRAGLASLVLAGNLCGQPCEPHWTDSHLNPEILFRPEYCLERLRVGDATELYSGSGYFEELSGVKLWDGRAWRRAGDGSPSPEPALALALFDEGAGPVLFGAWNTLFALRNGAWKIALSVDSPIRSFAPWMSGNRTGLYFGGSFSAIDGISAAFFGRWDGHAWESIGGLEFQNKDQTAPGVYALHVWDDGTGPSLYVGGRFDLAGGKPARSLARWNGMEWSTVGEPIEDNGLPVVYCLADHVDADGAALYVAGDFDGVAGISSMSIARWDGKKWSGLGGGLRTSIGNNYNAEALIYTLEWHDDGDGERLYAGGHITATADGTPVNFIARWGGQSWEPVPGGMKGPVRALRSVDDGRGPTLWVGSESEYADGHGVWEKGGWKDSYGWKQTGCIARYDKYGWHRPNSGGMEDSVRALLVRQEDGKQVVYAGGQFYGAGDGRQRAIARFDGHSWKDVGDWRDLGLVSESYGVAVSAFATLPGDDGIYVAQNVTKAGSGVARFDGQHWSWVGASFSESIYALGTHDDGHGARLYAGTYGDLGHVFRFDGQAWQLIGTCKGQPGGPGALVWSLGTLDDGSGPMLYAAGLFDSIDGVNAHDVARWNGSAWEAIGDAQFVRPGGYAQIRAISQFDAGGGSKIYVGGSFSLLNGQPCTLASWDGEKWEVVSEDVGYFNFARVVADGDSTALCLGGEFQSIAGTPLKQLGRLTRAGKWQAVDPTGKGFSYINSDGGDSGSVTDVASFDDPVSGPSLMVAGRFESAGGVSSGNVAQLILCPEASCPIDLDGNGALDLFDFLSFLNLFNAQDPAADCDADLDFSLSDFLCFVYAFNEGC